MSGAGRTTTTSIEVTVPTILRDCTGGRNPVSIEAATLAEALRGLLDTYPLLRVHLYDEAERLRPHVLIFFNEESTQWLESLDVPLRPGDRLEILQAVSGGESHSRRPRLQRDCPGVPFAVFVHRFGISAGR